MRRAPLGLRTATAAALLLLTAGCAGPAGDGTPERVARPPADPVPAADAPNRYNVLFLAVDDLRPELGCYGAEYVRTPHIDALAAEGVTFLNHFAAVPTCGASRYALLTGRSPAVTGIRAGNEVFDRGPQPLHAAAGPRADGVAADGASAGARSLPELFRRSGYHTTLIGKISHTPDGRVYAYDGSGDGHAELPEAWDVFATPYGPWARGWGAFFAYAGGVHREDGSGRRDRREFVVERDEELPDGLMAAEAERRIAAYAASGERFFLGVGFYKPHLPFVAPRADWEAVQDWPVPYPEPWGPTTSAYATRSGEFFGYHDAFDGSLSTSDPGVEDSRRAYLACVRYVDRQVGRVLDALETHGLADDTVVVLWSDHGWYLGEGAMWGKHTPLERALRCPLIVRVPGAAQAGLRTDALASALDVYPTLLELCRPADPRTAFPLDGVSQVPVLEGHAATVRESVTSWWRDATSLRTFESRMVTREGGGKVEVYEAGDARTALVDLLAPRPRIYAPPPLR